jgi:hypothetical protein
MRKENKGDTIPMYYDLLQLLWLSGGSQMWYILKIWIYYIKVGANASAFFFVLARNLGQRGFDSADKPLIYEN